MIPKSPGWPPKSSASRRSADLPITRASPPISRRPGCAPTTTRRPGAARSSRGACARRHPVQRRARRRRTLLAVLGPQARHADGSGGLASGLRPPAHSSMPSPLCAGRVSAAVDFRNNCNRSGRCPMRGQQMLDASRDRPRGHARGRVQTALASPVCRCPSTGRSCSTGQRVRSSGCRKGWCSC